MQSVLKVTNLLSFQNKFEHKLFIHYWLYLNTDELIQLQLLNRDVDCINDFFYKMNHSFSIMRS